VPVLTLSGRPAVLAAIDRARAVSLAAYILPRSVTAHLAAAARRGADVRLALAEYPVGADAAERRQLARANRAAVDTVRRAGGVAELVPPRDPLHLKAALIDDRVAFLDDRNWSDRGAQTILRDDDLGDVAVIRAALARRPAGNGHLRTVKPQSLALECGVIAAAGQAPLAVESESFGIGPIYDALLARAAGAGPTRLLVAARELDEARGRAARQPAAPPVELRALDRLRAAGVEVRVTPEAEKMAVGAGDAWLGSSNATRDWGSTKNQLDWGMRVPPGFVEPLRQRFERTWRDAVPYEPMPAPPAATTESIGCARTSLPASPAPAPLPHRRAAAA
jgi:hypothetical protein